MLKKTKQWYRARYGFYDYRKLKNLRKPIKMNRVIRDDEIKINRVIRDDELC